MLTFHILRGALLQQVSENINNLRLFGGKERKGFNSNLLENKSDSPVLQENVDQMVALLRTLTLLIAQRDDAFLSDWDLIGWDKERKKKNPLLDAEPCCSVCQLGKPKQSPTANMSVALIVMIRQKYLIIKNSIKVTTVRAVRLGELLVTSSLTDVIPCDYKIRVDVSVVLLCSVLSKMCTHCEGSGVYWVNWVLMTD